MSDRERIIQLVDETPEYKLGYVIAYLQGLNADEEEDDAFCEKLYQDYLNSDDKGGEIPFEEVARRCGVNLDELQNNI